MWPDWLVFCDCGFSLPALWCPLLAPIILLGFLLSCTWGISSWLFQQSTATAPYLGRGVSPQNLHSWPWTWGISSRPLLLTLVMGYLLVAALALHSSHSHHFLQIDGETVETVTDFILWVSKVTADGDCSHEIKRCLLLGRKVISNLDSILKSRDITMPKKVHLIKAMVFPIVMYGFESWTINKTESQRIHAFELWCWRRLLRVP